jgi:frataxin-like iron-binding protein CyaY
MVTKTEREPMQLWLSVSNTGGAKENHDKRQGNWLGSRFERGIWQIHSSKRIQENPEQDL